MCGIHGFTRNMGGSIEIFDMIDISNKRGPDGEGAFTSNDIFLGHNLLAITEEKEKSLQPIFNDGCALVYNGEIYNYKELRDSLSCEFKTDSDTEVLFKGLELSDNPLDFISRLDGMYALSFLDRKNNCLYLARDHAGVKPLYYYKFEDKFAFSSSLKSLFVLSIEKTLNKPSLVYYTHCGYVPGPNTLINNVYKLCPGQVLKINLNNLHIDKYSVYDNIKYEERDFDKEEFRYEVEQAVKQCLIGRREIGLFLSGGLDSSMILHEASKYLQNIKTFTTRFQDSGQDKKYNSDADCAKRLAALYNTEHLDFNISCKDYLNSIKRTINRLEEPRFGKNIPAYLLMNEEMAKRGIVVTLSGDGGDEVFTGYKHHREIKKRKHASDYIQQWAQIKNLSPNHVKQLNPEKCSRNFKSWFPDILNMDYINNHLFIECMTHLPEDYLIRNDKLGMSVSMEGRFPLTTKRFREYALGLRGKEKMQLQKEGLTAPFKVLPKLAYNGMLPDFIINKEKTGWSIPTTKWLSDKDFVNGLKKEVMSSDYYEPINGLFKIKDLKSNMKTDMTVFYFRLWAKEFNVSI